jgi:FkbM family methyltransferase
MNGTSVMPALRTHIKNFVQHITNWEIERLGEKSFALINKNKRADAWFSYQAQLKTVFEKYDINLVLDVGANQGQFAKRLRNFYAGDIISFEPVSEVFAALRENLSQDNNWHGYKFALGSKESMQRIFVPKHTVFSSFLKSNEYCEKRFGDLHDGLVEEIVTVRRLDNVLDEIVNEIDSKRIFIKMDTQGYDAEVFLGLGEKLDHVMVLQSEVSIIPIYENMPHWTESVSLYEEAGFSIIGMFPVTRDAEKIIEYDCLLSRLPPSRIN